MGWYVMCLFPLVMGIFCFEANWVQKFKDLEKWIHSFWSKDTEESRKQLEQALSRGLLERSQKSGPGKESVLPKYKFYTALYENLLTLRSKMGVSQEQNWKDLREGMINDGKFEKKVKAELHSSYGQFFLISLITWTFAFISLWLLEKSLSSWVFLGMLGLQVAGFLCFNHFFFAKKRELFKAYGMWFFHLYRFKTLLTSGQPIAQSIKESGVLELLNKGQAKFNPFKAALSSSISRLQKAGCPIQDEIKFCLEELWFCQECDFEHFLKVLSTLKLNIILIFYLGSYFLYLYAFISTFTTY